MDDTDKKYLVKCYIAKAIMIIRDLNPGLTNDETDAYGLICTALCLLLSEVELDRALARKRLICLLEMSDHDSKKRRWNWDQKIRDQAPLVPRQ